MRVILASTNPGKAAEFASVLRGTGLDPVSVRLWFGHEENARTYRDNAISKAAAVARITGMAVLAEDSGIEADALHGLPGPHSARFSGPAATDASNNEKLLRLLDGVDARTARYRAHAVVRLPGGRMFEGSGVFEGAIGFESSGTNGFGYDPLFIPTGQTQTVAELDPSFKDAHSHRAQALRALVEALASR